MTTTVLPRRHASTPPEPRRGAWAPAPTDVTARPSLPTASDHGRRPPRSARTGRIAADRQARLTLHPVTLVVRSVAVVLGLLPSALPHSAWIQAGVVLTVLLLAQPVVALGRRRWPAATAGRLLLRAVGMGLAVALPLEVVAAERLRTATGMATSGPAYWLAVAVLVTGAVLLARGIVTGVRRSGRFVARGWRGTLLAVLVVVLGWAALSAFAPSPRPGAPDPQERPLAVASPVGAVRVYAAARPGETLTARATRAADALVAAGGLHRRHVVVMFPTGSGWVDPTAVEGFEDRFGADVAEVSMQSTTTPSWVAYLFQRGSADAGARALFTAVADRIDALPPAQRPQLHLYGESLGAATGRSVFADHRTAARAADSVCSVLWVGPPGGHGLPARATSRVRQAVVANPTDPVVHTHLDSVVVPSGDSTRPWLPVVSFVQQGADFVASRSVPVGTGHRYGPHQADALPTC